MALPEQLLFTTGTEIIFLAPHCPQDPGAVDYAAAVLASPEKQ